MLPLASSSGPAIIGVVVIGAVLLLWWLLRGETREKETDAEREAMPEAAQEPTLEVAQAPPRAAGEDRLRAP
jgi:hypothetical protein